MSLTCRSNLEVNWSTSTVTFPLLIQLLSSDVYRYHVLLGLTANIGGFSQSLELESGNILLDYVKNLNDPRSQDDVTKSNDNLSLLERVASTQIDLFSENRIVVSLLKVIAQLMSHGCYNKLQPSRYNITYDHSSTLR